MKRNLYALLLILVVAALGAGIYGPRRAAADLVGCKSNHKNLATALEMYSSDNMGAYPASLRQLEGPYLRELPTCPVSGSDYSQTYRRSVKPDSFSYGCAGRHHGYPPNHWELGHTSSAEGYPWYDTERGHWCGDCP